MQNRLSHKYGQGPKAGKVPPRKEMSVQFKATESRKRAQQTKVVQHAFIARGRGRVHRTQPLATQRCPYG